MAFTNSSVYIFLSILSRTVLTVSSLALCEHIWAFIYFNYIFLFILTNYSVFIYVNQYPMKAKANQLFCMGLQLIRYLSNNYVFQFEDLNKRAVHFWFQHKIVIELKLIKFQITLLCWLAMPLIFIYIAYFHICCLY